MGGVGLLPTTDLNMSSGECYTQSVKVDEQVTLLGGSQVHLQPALLLIFIVVCFFEKSDYDRMKEAEKLPPFTKEEAERYYYTELKSKQK